MYKPEVLFNNNDRKYSNYRLFKTTFEFKNYLIKTPYQFLKFIIRFRIRNHRLPIETGSWSGIKSVERKCPLCKCSSSIPDEFHYLLECKSLENERKRVIDKNHYTNPNVIHFKSLMSCLNIQSRYIKLFKFIKAIICLFRLTIIYVFLLIVTKYSLVYVRILYFQM